MHLTNVKRIYQKYANKEKQKCQRQLGNRNKKIVTNPVPAVIKFIDRKGKELGKVKYCHCMKNEENEA